MNFKSFVVRQRVYDGKKGQWVNLEVDIDVNLSGLAARLGVRAMRAKGKKAVEANGDLVVRYRRHEPERASS